MCSRRTTWRLTSTRAPGPRSPDASTIGRTIQFPPISVTHFGGEWRINPTAEPLLDHYLPKYDVSEHHAIYVDTAPERAFEAVLRAPLGSSFIVRTLLKLRALAFLLSRKSCAAVENETATILDTIGHGFFLVDKQPGREIVLGTIGAFWKLKGGKRSAATSEQLMLPPPGTAAAIWNFRVAQHGPGADVHTETRVLCGDAAARRKFLRYWAVVGPFSALIRRQMLATIKDEAESSNAAYLLFSSRSRMQTDL